MRIRCLLLVLAAAGVLLLLLLLRFRQRRLLFFLRLVTFRAGVIILELATVLLPYISCIYAVSSPGSQPS